LVYKPVMKKKGLFLLLLFCSSTSYSQVNLSKYFNPGLPIVNNIYDHLKVDFTWNMKGPIQALINEGINELDEHDVPVALINLNKAIKLDSSNWVSHYYRGVCHKKFGQFEEAEQDFLTALSFNAKLAEAHIELGEIYVILRWLKKAEDQFDEAVKKKPSLADGYYNKGNIFFFQHNRVRAERFYDKSCEVNPAFANGYLMRGLLAYYLDKDNAKAISFYSQCIKADSSYSSGYFWRGMAFLQQNKLTEGLADWSKSVQLDPTNTFFTRMRGFLFIELNQFDNAFVDLKNAFKTHTEGTDENKFTGNQTILDQRIDLLGAANYLIANGYGLNDDAFFFLQKSFCLVLAGRNKEALESVNQAELTQPSATAYYLKALILESNQKHDQALVYYEKALTLDKDIFEVHRKKCVYHFEMKDYKSAYADLNEMFRLQPGSPVGHRFRGLIRSAQGFIGPAIGDLSAFIKTDTTDEIAIRARYNCYIVLKKWEESKKDAEWILKKSGTNWATYEEFVSEYLSAKDTLYAIKICDIFTKVAPAQFYWNHVKALEISIDQNNWDEAEVRMTKVTSMTKEENSKLLYAKLYYWKGIIARHKYHTPEEAISLFDKSIKLNINEMDARYAKADLYRSIGERKKALSAYKELMKWGFKDAKVLYEQMLAEKD
jgi:tetratricopeptide (TPR) repeat protein